MLLEHIKSGIREDLEQRSEELGVELDIKIEINSLGGKEKGFYASPLGFQLASELGKSPEDSVREFMEGLEFSSDYVTDTEAEAGYLNIFIDEEKFSRELVKEIDEAGNEYGNIDEDNGLAVIDESSPNVAKPMHIGHLRNTLLSDSLNRVLERTGYEVIADNHLGDWGGQFGNLMYAFKEWGSEEELEENPIDHLLDLYQRFGQKEDSLEGEELEEFREKGRKWFKKLEQDDEEAVELWEKFREVSIERFKETYEILDIEFDEWIGEAFYVREGWTDKVVDLALEKDVAEKKDDGSIVIEVGEPDPETGEKDELVIMKSDGSTLYSTRDLATILYREDRWDPEHMMYVVATEQNRYFQEVFEAARKLGFEDQHFFHVSYGMLSLPEGSMSTRKGRIISARQVIEEAEQKAEEIVQENNEDVSEEDRKQLARKIGLAALRYETLKVSREKDMVFDKEQALEFKGKTGPYLQYSFTRAKNILEKTEETDVTMEVHDLGDEEVQLVDQLSKLPLKMKEAEEKYDPSVIATYAYDLANSFSQFYHECPVKDSEGEIQRQRVTLVKLFVQVMSISLDILHIEEVELM